MSTRVGSGPKVAVVSCASYSGLGSVNKAKEKLFGYKKTDANKPGIALNHHDNMPSAKVAWC